MHVMDCWVEYNLPTFILTALEKASFTKPTPIQKEVFLYAIEEKCDILGAAPTGSGKTLAFGIPLIMNIYNMKKESFNSISNDLPNVEQIKDVKSFACNKKKRKKKCYSDLDFIEELDIETGKVSTIHTLDSNLMNHELDPVLEVTNERVYGIVLLPTRELALQVCKHLRMLTEFCDISLRVEAIVGGISIDKQIRLLRRYPDVIVATPGRLWQLIELGNPHILTVKHANVLVVDEADRLIEANHYEELQRLFGWLRSNSDTVDITEDEIDVNANVTSKNSELALPSRQTLVFSATLTFVHSGALKPGTGSKKRKISVTQKKNMTTRIKLGMLKSLLGLNKSVKIIDLSSSLTTPNWGRASGSATHTLNIPEGLKEVRLLSPNQAEKDVRLFWLIAFGRFLNCHESQQNQRSLIFVNSKAGVRRLVGIMRHLSEASAFEISGHATLKHVNVLHADMIQKQRLRSLERFQADPSGIMIASDVAARGLDLAGSNDTGGADGCDGITWVVHFDVPHTAELYIHRRGRTARANRTGTSVLLICPNEIVHWQRLAVSLKRSDSELPDLDVQPTDSQLRCCENIVNSAKQLDLLVHRTSRLTANKQWFEKAAKDADIVLDEQFETGIRKKKMKRDETNDLRCHLKEVIQSSRKMLLKSPKNLGIQNCRKLYTMSKLKLLKNIETN